MITETIKVFIVILQYNNSQDTIRCLNSVKELDYPNYNVIIVDNGSDVKHVNEIRNWIEKVVNLDSATHYSLLTTHCNLGYSGGNNIGIKYALERGADYVFILNPDTTIEKTALTELIKVAESDPKIGIVGPAINEGAKTVYGGKIEWLKPELSHLVVEPLSILSGSTTKYVIGACVLIKREVIEKIGLLDERYFLYFEDADYCLRAQKAGYKLALASDAVINHAVSASTGKLGSALLLRYHYRNAHLFNWKNGSPRVKLALPFWSISIIIKQLLKIIFVPAKREISRAILAGVGNFYKGRFGQII